jgi:two-component system chemotaxis response regulator CheY
MPNVLIVEDDPVASDLLELVLLRLPGVSVRILPSVEAARVALASEEKFDAVITDVHLPGEDGLSLIAWLREMPRRQGTPVIVTTSSREPSIRSRAEAMGVRAFIQKPWSASSLRDTVHSLFNET